MDPPESERELVERAEAIAGLSLGTLAARLGQDVPADLRRAKGWVGTLMEAALGATAGSRDEPDFPGLGIELKTIPVDAAGHPRETTFVCTITLQEMGDQEWERSRVRRKLARVLWIPVEAGPVPVSDRRVGAPMLWSPSAEEEEALRFDWEELAGIIGRGDVESITAHLGEHLQVRPKAASSRSRSGGVDRDGASFAALPRGFYLRTSFTRRLLQRHYALGDGRGADGG